MRLRAPPLPQAVVTEILAGPPNDLARTAVAGGWAERCSPTHVPPALLERGLGAGESAVLAVCLERGPATAVIDDAAARSAARVMNIPVIGTLGVVIRAKLEGLIPSAETILSQLRTAGFHLNQTVVRVALSRIGESPS
jgi:predicted nucleic acid-binding protein